MTASWTRRLVAWSAALAFVCVAVPYLDANAGTWWWVPPTIALIIVGAGR